MPLCLVTPSPPPQCLSVSSRLPPCRRHQSSVQPSVPLSSPILHPLHLPPAPRTLKPTRMPSSSRIMTLLLWVQTNHQQLQRHLEEHRNYSHLISVAIVCQNHCKSWLLLDVQENHRKEMKIWRLIHIWKCNSSAWFSSGFIVTACFWSQDLFYVLFFFATQKLRSSCRL